MSVTFTYNGLPLEKLPELTGKSRKKIIEELHSQAIDCEYDTYRRWINKDIKLSVLITICNLYHLPIFYFFNRTGYEDKDIKYTLQEEWTDIVPQYKTLGELIQKQYGSIRQAAKLKIISTTLGTNLLNEKRDNLDSLMISKFISIINKTGISLVSILPDDNLTFKQDHITKSYKTTIPGYDEIVMVSESIEKPDSPDDENYKLRMELKRTKQELLDVKSELYLQKEMVKKLQNIKIKNKK